MIPRRKQSHHCLEIAKNRGKISPKEMKESKEKLDPDIMVISGLIDGKGYEATKHTANRFNLLTPSKRTFYEHQKRSLKKWMKS